jgi:hypothetical protein
MKFFKSIGGERGKKDNTCLTDQAVGPRISRNENQRHAEVRIFRQTYMRYNRRLLNGCDFSKVTFVIFSNTCLKRFHILNARMNPQFIPGPLRPPSL